MHGTVIIVRPDSADRQLLVDSLEADPGELVDVVIEFDGGGRYVLTGVKPDLWHVGDRADVPRERWDFDFAAGAMKVGALLPPVTHVGGAA